MSKRITAFLLAALMAFSVFSAAFTVYAADSTVKTLISLTKKFPHKKYWNHVGSKKNDPDKVTSLPCPNHKNVDWNSEDITCNSFENAIQCMGFAYKIAYEITKTSPRTWSKSEKLNAKKLRVGDIIRYRNGSHSLVVTGVKGEEIAFVDANWYPGCQIRWGRMKLDDMPGFSYILHLDGNNRKNADLDFHKSAVERGEREQQELIEEAESWKMNNEGWLNVRAGASTKKSIIGQIPPEATFTVSEKKSTGEHLWGLVTYGSLEGWAVLDYSTYLSGSGNEPIIEKPKGVFAVGEEISVSWKKTPGATVYTLEAKDSSGKTLAKVKTKSATAKFTAKAPDKIAVTVTAGNSLTPSWQLKSEEVEFTVTVVPSKGKAPFQSASKTKRTFITVEWKSVPGASGYRLYRYNKKKNTYKFLCETDKTSFTVRGLEAGTDYYFSVRPFAEVNGKKFFGAASDPVCLSTKPESPAVSGRLSKKKAVFRWKKVKGATEYEVYVKRNGKYVLQKRLSASKTAFEKKLASKEKCVLRVRAVKKSKAATLCSAFSKTVTVRG